jgi:hypothetical protein
MDFPTLLDKIGRGEVLPQAELDFLRNEAKAIEEVKNIVKQNSILLGNTFHNRPIFLKSPSDTILFYRTTDTAIADNTATFVSIEGVTGKSDTIYLDPADATKIKIRWSGHVVLVFGYDEWDSNATGYRAAQIQVFDAAGNSLGTTNLHVSAPVNGDVTGCSWVMIINKDIFPSFDYFKIIVRQTSGGALNLRTMFVQTSLI